VLRLGSVDGLWGHVNPAGGGTSSSSSSSDNNNSSSARPVLPCCKTSRPVGSLQLLNDEVCACYMLLCAYVCLAAAAMQVQLHGLTLQCCVALSGHATCCRQQASAATQQVRVMLQQ
jgi:hypothetical protein